MSEALADLIAAETARNIPLPVRAFAAALAEGTNGNTVAVLFYGSNLRTGDLDGVLDFYVLIDSLSAWHSSIAAAIANRALPPNVEYREHKIEPSALRAKVAVMTSRQFAAATRFSSYDTTIWARFSQPISIAWVRDAEAHANMVSLLTGAVATAARWAALLGPERGTAGEYWRALYAATYAIELRVERTSRSEEIVAHAADRYARLLEPAWRTTHMEFTGDANNLKPQVGTGERTRARRAWAVRRLLGRPLNVARLMKAAFTFKGGAAYLAWKIERHTKTPLDLTPWQKRHPILAAPRVLWRLWQQSMLR